MPPRVRIDTMQMQILVNVVRERSLTQAARTLGMAPSSVSYALSHLREEFGDPLFQRQNGRLEPTRQCLRLADNFQQILEELTALRYREDYDPAADHGSITVAANYYERLSIIPRLIRRLSVLAPRLQINICEPMINGVSALITGMSDLQLSAVPVEASGFSREVVLRDRYKCYAWRGAGYHCQPMTLKRYIAARHIVVSYDRGWRPYYMLELEKLGMNVIPSLRLASLGGIKEILTDSDYLLTAASRLRPTLGEEIVEIEPPFSSALAVYMCWPGRHEGDRRNFWLRGQVREAIAEEPAASA